MKNVLEYLENTARIYPDKRAAIDDKKACSYSELLESARKIGSYIAGMTTARCPVCVMLDKSVDVLKTFMGIVYAGCFYTLIDPSFPDERIDKMLGVLKAEIVITDADKRDRLIGLGYTGAILDIDKLLNIGQADDERLLAIRNEMVDTDPLYCNFTSGSTGVPKGVLVCHRSVIDFIDCFTELFDITNEDVIGNQAPFDFDVSVKDIYSAIKTGATIVIIPKQKFMFPNAVVDMLEENNVTTLIWAVSALCLLNRLHGLKYKVPAHINKILFSGEAMPVKQLNAWKSYYPDAMFVNLYGPTEITCNCTYYIVDREYGDDDKLPMGNAFPNERVFLLDENDNEIKPDMANVRGEICVAGTSLALGYYNNAEMTKRAFIQNPLNKSFNEIIYRTGDLACYDEEGRLSFAGRKDFQIKHMGHRIELEEIERELMSVSVVCQVCCFYDERKNKVVAYYVGDENKKKIIDEMKTKVPEYMVPNVFLNVEELPVNKNGKTNRKLLREQYEGRA